MVSLYSQLLESYLFASRAWTEFKSRDLEASLRHQCHSLEEISLTDNFLFIDEEGGDIIEPMTFSDFTCLKIFEISLPFVYGMAALLFDEGTSSSPDATAKYLKSMSERLIDMIPYSVEEIRFRFPQFHGMWAAKLLNMALLEFLAWRRARCLKLKRIELHFYPDKANKYLPELQTCLEEASRLEIEVKAFQGGRLGRENVGEEGWRWRIGEWQDELAEAVQIPT